MCPCKKKRGITGRNLTDVMGKTAVDFGEEILEGDACGTGTAETRDCRKLRVGIQAGREMGFDGISVIVKTQGEKKIICASDVWVGKVKVS